MYHIVFSPVCQRAGVSSLDVKYDIFRHGDEGTWIHINIHNTKSLIHTLHVCLRHLEDGRNLYGERVHTHLATVGK